MILELHPASRPSLDQLWWDPGARSSGRGHFLQQNSSAGSFCVAPEEFFGKEAQLSGLRLSSLRYIFY
jgi:hypothetical protein